MTFDKDVNNYTEHIYLHHLFLEQHAVGDYDRTVGNICHQYPVSDLYFTDTCTSCYQDGAYYRISSKDFCQYFGWGYISGVIDKAGA